MGIESQYLGEINIPEEHRAEYAQQALKLLRAGGMVTVEPVQLYGHKLYLLSPPELDEEDGKAVGHYNYLDENSGERWCLNAKDGWFGCGKIIGSCYYSTIAAVHILTTLWSTSYAATLINGCPGCGVPSNHRPVEAACRSPTAVSPAGSYTVCPAHS